MSRTQLAAQLAHFCERLPEAAWSDNQLVEIRVVLQQRGAGALDNPGNIGIREMLAQSTQHRNRVNAIARSAQPADQNAQPLRKHRPWTCRLQAQRWVCS